MIRPGVILAAWGALLALLALILLLFSPPQHDWALLAGAAMALAPLGSILLLPGARPESEPRALPESSLPTVVIAGALALIALGIAAGVWLVAVGAEVAVVGLFLLAREIRAQRRQRRR